MTPTLQALEQWLPPFLARIILALIYAISIISIALLVGYEGEKTILYLDIN